MRGWVVRQEREGEGCGEVTEPALPLSDIVAVCWVDHLIVVSNDSVGTVWVSVGHFHSHEATFWQPLHTGLHCNVQSGTRMLVFG